MKLLLITFLLSTLYSQAIVGSWMLKEHYSSGMLTISSPYLNYQFVSPDFVQISIKQNAKNKGFDYFQAGNFKVSDDSLKLTVDGDLIEATYSIQGDSLFTMKVGEAKLIFRRVKRGMDMPSEGNKE